MAGTRGWLGERLRLDWWFWLALVLPLVVLAIIGGILVGAPSRGLRALEGAIGAVVGALIARLFIGWLIGPRRDETSADQSRNFWIMLGFFLSPIVVLIELVPLIRGRPFLSSAKGLLWLASIVGGVSGMYDGIYRTQPGSVAFFTPLDVTWGLSGQTNGVSLHLVNTTTGQHRLADTAKAPATRTGAHQYDIGFAIKSSAAFTQGNVMSNMGSLDSVFWHEMAHVWQNRVFGPWFTLGYVEWMAASLVPGFHAAVASGESPGDGIYAWAYADNPYERVGYAIEGGPGTPPLLTWPLMWWLFASLPFYAHGIVLLVRARNRLWRDREVFRFWNILEPLRGFTPAIVALGNVTIWTAIAGGGGAVIGWILAVIGWWATVLPLTTDGFAANSATRFYKIVLGWASWLMPMCWPGHAIGLLMFLVNFIGIRAFRVHWRGGSFQSIGGIIGRRFGPGRGFTIGGFSVLNDDHLTEASMHHEGGHALNHAAFGLLHLGHVLRFAGRDNTFIKMAESHVPSGLRRTSAWDQGEEWPRLRLWGPGLTQH